MAHPLSIAADADDATASAAPEPPPSPTPAPPPAPRASLHHLLLEHAFIPLALCATLGLAFWFTRLLFTRSLGYDFLIKNLFLAWLPYFFSLAAVSMQRSTRVRPAWHFALVWSAWLVTLPNAPYIFTDLIHWRNRPPVMPWWFDLGLVLMFGLAGCFAGIVSLKMMHDLVRRAIGGVGGWAFVTSVALLSGFGIYLGRFERWNSWDLLIQPRRMLTQTLFRSLGPQSVDRTFGVTLMFGAMILVTYVMFVSMNPSSSSPLTRSEIAR
jgi:uncharacterized membrane protein